MPGAKEVVLGTTSLRNKDIGESTKIKTKKEERRRRKKKILAEELKKKKKIQQNVFEYVVFKQL